MILYHASSVANIDVLEPSVSNHNKPLIYFSLKKENVAVYLSNAVEKFCKETEFKHNGKYYKWASYGFDADGILRLEEYYPNATKETYSGVSGYIYTVEFDNVTKQADIPFAYVSEINVPTINCEFIPDAYSYIIELVSKGKLRLKKYDDNDVQLKDWIEKTVIKEYCLTSSDEYKHFLRAKFKFLNKI